MITRRTLLRAVPALLMAPAIIRASSLDFIPRNRIGTSSSVNADLSLSPWQKDVIRKYASPLVIKDLERIFQFIERASA